MKIRSLIAGAAAASLAAGFFAPSAHAAGDTAVTFTLASGNLSIDVADNTIDLGTVTPDSASQIGGDLSATTVTDARNSLAGWTAYAYSSAFAKTGGGATDIPAANVNVSIDPVSAITANLRGGALSPTDIGTIFTATVGGADGDATHDTSISGGSIGVLSGSSLTTLLGSLSGGLLGGSSNSTLTYTPTVSITVPAGQADGVYTGTVYQTVS
jgi:hypothetical protein